MTARFVPSNVSEMVDWLAGAVTAQTGMILNIGAGGASGNLAFQTNSVERFKISFTGAITTPSFELTDTVPRRFFLPVTMTNPGSSGRQGMAITAAGKGNAGTTGVGLYGLILSMSDAAGTTGVTISSWANNGGLFEATTSGSHGLTTGDSVVVSGVTGTTTPNRPWLVTVVSATKFTLTGSTYAGGAVGGTVTASAVVNKTITGMSRSGSTITVTATAHGFATGDQIAIYGVTSTFNVSPNLASYTIANATTNTFDITVTGLSSGTYTSGGTATNRHWSTGLYVQVAPALDRNVGMTGGLANAEDAGVVTVKNTGTGKANEAFYIGSAPYATVGHQAALSIGATVDIGVQFGQPVTYWGIDFAFGGTSVTYGSGAIRLPNNVGVYGRNAADSADVQLFKINTANRLAFISDLEMAEGANFAIGSSTGTKFGTSIGQKIGFYNATPITQPAGTTDLRTALINLGLYASGGASPLNLNGGALTAGTGSFGGAVNMNTHKITSLAAATANGDAVGWPWPLIGGVVDVQVFGAGTNQTWTNPNVGTVAVVIVKGAGGGGGGGVNSASAGNPRSGGAGGGGGGWSEFAVPLAALGATCNVNVASGGAGGTAGNAGSNASGTTAFDSAGGNANVTAATGGAAGSSGSSTGGTGGVATAPTYAGYSVTSTVTNGGTGGAGTTGAAAGGDGSSVSGGGAGGGCSTTPTGQTGGTGAVGSFTLGTVGKGGVGGAAAALTQGAPSLAGPFAPTVVNSCGGGGGGGCHTNGNGAGRGANGYAGGGGGGGGSCVNGAAGLGGNGGDGVVIVLVY